MQRLLFAAMIAVMIGGLPVVTAGADSAWKMPNLNPFAGKAKPASAASAGNPPMSGWHGPKLWPKAAVAKRKAPEPTTWNKMTSGTRNFFSKTADVLNPWDDKPAKPPLKVTGSNTAFTHNHPAKPETSGGSILPAAWWSSDKKDQPPKSVNDFLSQPRPH